MNNNQKPKTKVIYQYVRGRKGNLIGVCLATDKDKVSFSLCNPKDKFCKHTALSIAMTRCLHGHNVKEIPHSVKKTMDAVKGRAERYFKN